MTDDNAQIQNALNALQSINPYERFAAVETLARYNVQSALEKIIDATADPHQAVREGALWALGDMPHPDALPTLRAIALNADEDVTIRCAAIYGIGRIGDASLLEPLLALCETASNSAVRGAALRAVIRYGAGALDTLVAILADADGETTLRRVIAAHLMGALRLPEAIPALENAARDEALRVSWTAVWSLGEIADARTTDFLIDLLDDEAKLARIIVWALENIGTPDARRTARYWRKDNNAPRGKNNPHLPPGPPRTTND
ncbi:MAG: HEAT repeat domain-containing protein [Chloroflexota bacterium]